MNEVGGAVGRGLLDPGLQEFLPFRVFKVRVVDVPGVGLML